MADQKRVVQAINSLVVSAYKILGFGILFFILGGLLAYLSGQAFYLLDESWVAPTIITASDERVLKLDAELAARLAERDRLQAERVKMVARIADAERIVGAERIFQERFRLALQADRKARSRELAQLQALQKQFDAASDEITRSNQAYAGLERTRAETLHAASLIDRETFLTQNHQLAQLAQSNLDFAGRRVGLDSQLFSLERNVGALSAASARIGGSKSTGPISADVLQLEQQFTRSVLESQRAEADKEAMIQGVTAIDAAIARYDSLVKAVDGSPFLEASKGDLTIAFVPYANIDSVDPGTALYACDLGIVWCHRVGRVEHYLDGEVNLRHPARNLIVRGRMAVIDLVDPHWVQKDLLHAGRAPLFF